MQVIPGVGVTLEVIGSETQNPFLTFHATATVTVNTHVSVSPATMPDAVHRVLRLTAASAPDQHTITVEASKGGEYVRLIGEVQTWMSHRLHMVAPEAPLATRRDTWLREFRARIRDTLTAGQQTLLERLGFFDTVGLATNNITAVLQHTRNAYNSDLQSDAVIERVFESSIYFYAEPPSIQLGTSNIVQVESLSIDCGSREGAGNFRDAALAISRYISKNPIPFDRYTSNSPITDKILDKFDVNKIFENKKIIKYQGNRVEIGDRAFAVADFASDVGNPLPAVAPSFHSIALGEEYDLGIPVAPVENPAETPQDDRAGNGE